MESNFFPNHEKNYKTQVHIYKKNVDDLQRI